MDNNLRRSDTPISLEYRGTFIPCTASSECPVQTEGPYDVTIVNRAYHKGRHIVNVKEVAEGITAMDHVKSTRSE